jgi:hypothetical protein
MNTILPIGSPILPAKHRIAAHGGLAYHAAAALALSFLVHTPPTNQPTHGDLHRRTPVIANHPSDPH